MVERSGNHLLYVGISVDGYELDIWMLLGKYPEYFIGKGLAYRIDSSEIKLHAFKALDSCKYPFSLRA